MKRFAIVSGTFLKYIVFYKITAHRKENLGQRLKVAFEQLGITFIKIGQILSMRYDLLSREDCEALQELLDKVNIIPAEKILAILKEEYGDISKVFRKFDNIPLGSASVSQVHKAELLDGTVVAVKIKRPNVDQYFAGDIKILKTLATAGNLISPTLRHIQIRELVKFFERWIQQDLDFVLEAKNMERVREQYKFGETKLRRNLGRGIFIRPFKDFCTKNVVVMDYVDGITLSKKELLLNNPSYDVHKSIKTYVSAATRNWFRDDIETYIFQADPHLSNILALPKGDAASIDCGLISEISKREAELCRNLIIAVYVKDLESTIRIATEITGVSHAVYAPIIRADLEIYLSKTSHEGIGFWFMEFIKIMIKHRIKFPLYLTTFGRTNVILDGLIKTYMPEQTTVDILGEELRSQAIKESIDKVLSANWFKIAYSLGQKVETLPDLISDFIDNPFAVVSKVTKEFRK